MNSRFCWVSLHCTVCVSAGSEACGSVIQMRSEVRSGVMECWTERAAGWRMEPTVSFRVSAGASRMITSAPLCFQHHAGLSVGFYYTLLLHTPHIFTHTLLSPHLAVPPPLSYQPPSLPARLGAWTSPVGWIRGRFPSAVGCNPKVWAEPRQSPPWACYVPDLWHQASERHFRVLRESTFLLDAGQTEQPAGQQTKGLQRDVLSSLVAPKTFFCRRPSSSTCVCLN